MLLGNEIILISNFFYLMNYYTEYSEINKWWGVSSMTWATGSFLLGCTSALFVLRRFSEKLYLTNKEAHKLAIVTRNLPTTGQKILGAKKKKRSKFIRTMKKKKPKF
ncbi:hypothetical protein SNEBB_001009 [Seison nebaliae]|nr:hypothetical protein SNEBB_001009 [Seison nebaliae]